MRRRGLFFRKAPSLALPPEKIDVGEILGGEAASLREAPLPQNLPQTPLSPQFFADALVFGFVQTVVLAVEKVGEKHQREGEKRHAEEK